MLLIFILKGILVNFVRSVQVWMRHYATCNTRISSQIYISVITDKKITFNYGGNHFFTNKVTTNETIQNKH